MTGKVAPVLADSHVHFDRYAPPEIDAMLGRARRAGVRHFLAVGVDEASSGAAVALARRRRRVLAAVGVHPTGVAGLDLDRTLRAVRALANDPKVVAIGEVGLHAAAGGNPDMAEQEAFFRAFLGLAAELELAVVLHVAGAHRRALEILAEARPQRAVVHYFQGDRALAEAYVARGCLVSVGKPASRPENAALREAVAAIPLDRLLLETDTYPLPGRTTEPRDVAAVCQAVAGIRGIGYESVARATTENYRRVFSPATR